MFWTRLANGIVLVIIAILTMGYGGLPLWGILLLTSMVGYIELTRAMKCLKEDEKTNVLQIVGLLGVIGYYCVVYFVNEPMWMYVSVVGAFMAFMFTYVFAFPKFMAEQVAAAIFSLLYAPVMLSFIYLTREGEAGLYMVWLALISAWGCDTCAYVVGKLIGKKKIFPTLSPHKSMEGCIGGVLGAALSGGLYGYFFVERAYPDKSYVFPIAFICAIGAIMSMVGDLAASAIKRNNQIKDYGKIIPGHGGVMDRFDSMIVTAPMVYFLTMVWF